MILATGKAGRGAGSGDVDLQGKNELPWARARPAMAAAALVLHPTLAMV